MKAAGPTPVDWSTGGVRRPPCNQARARVDLRLAAGTATAGNKWESMLSLFVAPTECGAGGAAAAGHSSEVYDPTS